MRIAASIKTCKNRDKNCKIVRRKKTRSDGSQKAVLVVINKKNPRFKVSQGQFQRYTNNYRRSSDTSSIFLFIIIKYFYSLMQFLVVFILHLYFFCGIRSPKTMTNRWKLDSSDRQSVGRPQFAKAEQRTQCQKLFKDYQ